MQVNLTGTFLGCQVIGKHMITQGKGSIINIASLYGVVSPNHRIYPGTGTLTTRCLFGKQTWSCSLNEVYCNIMG